jgi:DNA-binding transcriptional MerR regulator
MTTRNNNAPGEFRPASIIYRDFGIPRSQLRALAERGVIRAHEKVDVDGINVMRVYSVADVARYMDGGGTADGD